MHRVARVAHPLVATEARAIWRLVPTSDIYSEEVFLLLLVVTAQLGVIIHLCRQATHPKDLSLTLLHIVS